MKIKALGIHGGISPDMRSSSFYINDKVVIDAGSVATALSVEEQLKIDHIFISHAHLDHIKDLAFLSDTVCGVREMPVRIYSSAEVLQGIKTHFFNNVIWPDFTKIPTAENPTIEFVEVGLGKWVEIEGVWIKCIAVNHPVPAVGFIVKDEEASVVISGDTGPTDELWRAAREQARDPKAPLRGIITEVSFPNALQHIADLAGHFTAANFESEVKAKFPKGVPIYLYHLKPTHWDQVMGEVEATGLPGIQFLSLGETLIFTSHSLQTKPKKHPQVA